MKIWPGADERIATVPERGRGNIAGGRPASYRPGRRREGRSQGLVQTDAASAGHRLRGKAVEILTAVDEGSHSDDLLDVAARGFDDERDRALLFEIVLGTLRRRGAVDAVLANYSSRPLSECDPPVGSALRTAVYQILFLDRVPDSAAVDGAVQAARERSGPGAATFVNGVLRQLVRSPMSEREALMAESESHPAWLANRIVSQWGEAEGKSILAANDHPAPVALRLRQPVSRESMARELAREGVITRPSLWVPESLVVETGIAWKSSAFLEGRFTIQDEATMLVAGLCRADETKLPSGRGEQRPLLVVDLCAAPGGKTFAIADAWADQDPLAGAPRIIACDRHAGRIRRMRANARRLDSKEVVFLRADALQPSLAGGRFDLVMLDAPCSGTGVIRRHPEIRWRLTPAEVDRLAARQMAMLDAAVRLCRPGGVLVYSVCSIDRAEGEEVIERVLTKHTELAVEDPRPCLPEAARSLLSPRGFLRTFPHRDGMDGHFAVRLRRS